jgi:hypothetical protein
MIWDWLGIDGDMDGSVDLRIFCICAWGSLSALLCVKLEMIKSIVD